MDEESKTTKKDVSKLFNIVKNHKEHIERIEEKIKRLEK